MRPSDITDGIIENAKDFTQLSGQRGFNEAVGYYRRNHVPLSAQNVNSK